MKAFPTEHPIVGTMGYHADGMDLRDYFAAKAMQSLINAQRLLAYQFLEKEFVEDIYKASYVIADAMMEARELNKKELA